MLTLGRKEMARVARDRLDRRDPSCPGGRTRVRAGWWRRVRRWSASDDAGFPRSRSTPSSIFRAAAAALSGPAPIHSRRVADLLRPRAMADEVIERLIRQHLVVVHGDSGCGKSSLVRAGVLPGWSRSTRAAASAGGPAPCCRAKRRCAISPRRWPARRRRRARRPTRILGSAASSTSARDAPAALAELLRRGERRSRLHPGRPVRGAVRLRPAARAARRRSCSSTFWSACEERRRPASTRS